MNRRRKGRALERKIRRLCDLPEDQALAECFVAMPDVPPILLPNGAKVIFEAKKRAAIPTYVRQGLEQCRRYAPDAVPVVVIEENRGEPLAVVPLDLFVQLVGIRPLVLPAQPTLPIGGRNG